MMMLDPFQNLKFFLEAFDTLLTLSFSSPEPFPRIFSATEVAAYPVDSSKTPTTKFFYDLKRECVAVAEMYVLLHFDLLKGHGLG